MNIPDKIYLLRNKIGVILGSWFSDSCNQLENIEYIRKDALLEWLNEYKDNPVITELQQGNIQELIEKIESL